MPVLFVFLLKVNIALIVFCLGYYLVLRKLTFYTLNRVYLVSAIIFSSVYPLIDINDFLTRHQEIAAPVQVVAINWQASQRLIEQPAYWQWATILLWLGGTVFTMRLLMQFSSLYKLYRKSKPATIHDYQVRVTEANISPFSFWKNIYINPDNIEAADLNSVLQHEQVHVKEWHTLDILLTEISVIFYWFNPGVWLMKRAVRENIEFITDRKVLQKGVDTKAYQYSLLHVSIAGTTSAGISNHFNFSTLKKRIKMMNTKKSSNLNLTRYAVLVPMVTMLLLVFSFSKAEIIKENREQLTDFIAETVNPEVDKNTDLVKPKSVFKKTKTNRVKDTTNHQSQGLHYVKVKGMDLPVGVPYGMYAKSIEKNTDTIVKTVTIRQGKRPDSVSVFINGKAATQEDLAKIASNIKDVRILQASDLVNKVTKIRVNGETQTVGQVHFSYNINNDTTYRASKITTNSNADLKKFNPNVTYSYTAKSNFTTNRSQPTTVSDKLMIIDGKEATEKEMKKISAADIEKIQIVDPGKEMTDKYGDKAKNGVIFYTTKKNR